MENSQFASDHFDLINRIGNLGAYKKLAVKTLKI